MSTRGERVESAVLTLSDEVVDLRRQVATLREANDRAAVELAVRAIDIAGLRARLRALEQICEEYEMTHPQETAA